MKTSNLSIRQLTGKFSVLFLIAAAFLTGCQKDQLPTPKGSESNKHNEIARMAAPVYLVTSIDHSDPQRVMPSYKVELFSDGLIQFEGRENTVFIGRVQALASQDIIDKINAIFKQKNFSSMIDVKVLDSDARVETTFASFSTAQAATHIDNLKKPQELVSLRQAVEDILKIGKWVK